MATTITNEQMQAMLQTSRTYSVVILRSKPKRREPGVEPIIWEHARRNFSLRADGLLSIVCAINDGTEVSGVGVFPGSVDEVKAIMDDDPGVQAGVFEYEIHPCRSFPGDSLPQ